MLGCLLLVSTAVAWVQAASTLGEGRVGIRFLVTVNDTWGTCIDTVATPMLLSGKTYNQSGQIYVGKCDQGPLDFNVRTLDNATHAMEVDLTFHSSVIEDASPPTCQIPWNGTYLVPHSQDPKESLLPGCWTAESREGYHMTYYWFYLLEWKFL